MFVIDPLALDRALERFAGLSLRFQRALRVSDAAEHAFELRPRELGDELLAELSNGRDPLSTPLNRWAHELLVRHACLEAERRVAHARFRDSEPFDQPVRGQFSPHALLENALDDSAQRASWIAALQDHAARLSAARFQLWETREEALQRFPAAARPPEYEKAIELAANRLLASSRDAYLAFELRSFDAAIELALGRDAIGEYPTRLTPQTLVELLGEGTWLKGLTPELANLPRLLGSSSLLRAFARLGQALHRSAAERRKPFVLHHDPFERRALFFSALFGLIPLSRAFAERRLSVARARFADYERASTRVLLLGARAAAFRALLVAHERAGSRAYRSVFVERSYDCFGFELPAALASALFVRKRAQEEFAGLLLALAENAELTERHDEDWFRNPRAIDELRARFEAPAWLELDEARLTQGNELLSRKLLAAL
jgi:hypothetical protein